MAAKEEGDKVEYYKVDAANKHASFSKGYWLYTFTHGSYALNTCAVECLPAKDICGYKYYSAKFNEKGLKEFTFIKDLRDEF